MIWEEMSYNRYNDRNDELWDERDEQSFIIIDETLILYYVEEE